MPLLLLALYNLIAAVFNLFNALALDRFGRIRIITTGLVCGSHPGSFRLYISLILLPCFTDRLHGRPNRLHSPSRAICRHRQPHRQRVCNPLPLSLRRLLRRLPRRLQLRLRLRDLPQLGSRPRRRILD